ncbi:C39 family peptidase [Candidatus Woesearchaeota archaeon]|nr:C39 family peptidase [Candidatus Woesearchaeota archaeon]
MVAKRAAIYVKPTAYIQQKWMDCGAYAVKAVMNLYGEDLDLPPRKYLSSLGKIFFGFMFPSTIKHVFSKTKKFTAPILRAKKSKHKLLLLKKELEQGHPVIILINNIYTKQRKKALIKKYYALHWVTLLGYDDEKKIFYVYDSLPHTSTYQKGLPAGNFAINYGDFLTFWKGRFISKMVNYLYIPVRK